MGSAGRRPDQTDQFFARLLGATAICWGLALGSLVGSTMNRASIGGIVGAVAASIVAFLVLVPVGSRREGTISRAARAAILIALPLGAGAAWFTWGGW